MNFLIVDDEVWSRRCIKVLLENSDAEIDHIFEAEDGITALGFFSDYRIDIVFSDIRMPEMDGLVFLEKVKRLSPSTKCAIISGFGDFEYAKSAISLGVVDYILKPIQKQNFLETLSLLIKGAKDENKNIEEKRVLQSLISSSREKNVRQLFQYLLEGKNLNKQESAQFKEYLGCDNGQFCCTCVSCKAFSSPAQLENTSEEPIRQPSEALTLLSDLLNSSKGAIVESINGLIHVFLIENHTNEDLFMKKTISQTEKLMEVIKLLDLPNVEIGYGTCVHTIDDVHTSYLHSITDLKRRIFLPFTALTDTKTLPDAKKYQLYATFENELSNAVQAGNFAAIEEKIRKYISLYLLTDKDVDLLENFLLHCSVYGNRLLMIENMSITEQKKKLLQLDLLSYRDITHLTSSLINYFSAISEQICNPDLSDGERAVQLTCQYLDEHYREDISLTTMAKKMSINASYLSNIFKERTQVNFTEYLTNIRMKNACDMLQNSSLSINKISELTGYDNERYFSFVFKKRYGVTPKQYRHQKGILS